jgi:hypothetical protein
MKAGMAGIKDLGLNTLVASAGSPSSPIAKCGIALPASYTYSPAFHL